MKDRRPLKEQVRDKILGLSGLVRRAPAIHQMSHQELEQYAERVREGASGLNAAHHRLIRLIRQQKKTGAAGAVHETRK